MKRLLCLSALLFFPALNMHVAEKEAARIPSLSPQEIAEGWILLFDGETSFGWKIDGEAKVTDGTGVLGGAKATTATLTTAFDRVELRFEYRKANQGKDNRLASLRWRPGREGVTFPETKAGETVWGQGLLRINPDGDHCEIRSPGGKANTFNMDLPERKEAGPVRITFATEAGNPLLLRNVKLRPLGLEPIFNGKDLSSWKEIPGKKSKFSVTDRGELHVQDGPGDLQTEGQWDDFVLQIEVFSNGPHLNSGVFFRCLPGQFWSGYEAQIRNQWEGDDRAKPVDYGTGGIYNRQPARKVVSSDREWFTMTVAAEGTHLAVWVNGYQTADFTDTRPANASARKGTKVDRGPFSLQGHDKTTDLRFRNIRVGPVPRGP